MSRTPVRGIGRADPPGSEVGPIAQQLINSITQSENGLPMINADTLKGAPPWAVFVMNQVQNCMAEVSAVKLALMRRGLLTEAELMESLLEISRAYEAEFMSMAGKVDRVMNQQPGRPVTTDPRQPPK